MKDKKTEIITLRTTEHTKKKLEEEAQKRGWSLSQLAEKILTTYTEDIENQSKQINFIGNTISKVNIDWQK